MLKRSPLLPLTTLDDETPTKTTRSSPWRSIFTSVEGDDGVPERTRYRPRFAENLTGEPGEFGSPAAITRGDSGPAVMTSAKAGSPSGSWPKPSPASTASSPSMFTSRTLMSESSTSTAKSAKSVTPLLPSPVATTVVKAASASATAGAAVAPRNRKVASTTAAVAEADMAAPPRRLARVATTVAMTPSWGWRWFRSEFFSLLIVFAPVAIAAGALSWSPRVVFALCALSLAGLEVFISTTLERVSLSYMQRNFAAAVLLEIIPVVFPTMIGIVAIVDNEISLAKSFAIGNVLNNILLGTGAALFVGGIKPSHESYAEDVGETALELVKLTLIASAPIIMAWAMIYVMTQQTEVTVDTGSTSGGGTTAVSTTTTDAIVGLSRGTAVVLLVVYLLWVLFRRGTHRGLFVDDDRGRRAAALAVRNNWKTRRQPQPKLKEKEGAAASASASASTKQQTRVFASLPTPAAAVLVPAAVAAALAAAIWCSYYLIDNVDALVGSPEPAESPTSTTTDAADAAASTSSLQRHFVASILLPLIVNLYSYVRAAELASCGGSDVSLAVQLTYGAGASAILLTLPVLVLVGWAAGHPLLLDFAAFDVSILAGAVWATSILVTNHVDYFRGFVLLCLYIIIALAIFLFKE